MRELTQTWFGPRHTTLEEKAKLSFENRQVAWATEKAITGVIEGGAEVAERIADTRKKVCAATRYAATFHDEVEELGHVEEISEVRENQKTGHETA